ncbi:hypothetical protein ABTX34_26240 [Streptomyces sp. NPDC096538]|uniref:hypothetical protein n=1 Tax=Streptomyces sp. NPDC096538 TaxID=3155427 RepID=UPI00332D97EF
MLAHSSALAAGRRHSVGRRGDVTVLAVGDTPAAECRVERRHDVVVVAAGDVHTASNTGKSLTVGLRSDGTVVATGWNGDGQCDVARWRGVVAVAAGRRRTLGLLANGRVPAQSAGTRKVSVGIVSRAHNCAVGAQRPACRLAGRHCPPVGPEPQCDVDAWSGAQLP